MPQKSLLKFVSFFVNSQTENCSVIKP